MFPVGTIAIMRAQKPRAVEAHARPTMFPTHIIHCGQAAATWALWAPLPTADTRSRRRQSTGYGRTLEPKRLRMDLLLLWLLLLFFLFMRLLN